MSQQTAHDNDFLFRAGRHRQEAHAPTGSAPRHREEATRSWWLDFATREGFQQAIEHEQQRMARSYGAKLARGMVIGGFKTVTGGK